MAILPEGWRHVALGDTGSTNTECLEAARTGDPGNLWITARRQLAGRGSRGRSWVSEPGNLYASLLLAEPGPLRELPALTFVASLAIRDAILDCDRGGGLDVRLKWPNDVLVNGRKVSGILLESHEIDGRRFVIIGQGINIAHAPSQTLHPATALAAEGMTVTPEALFVRLAHRMAEHLAVWAGGEGTSRVIAEWRQAAAGFGRPVTIRIPGRDLELSGTMEDVAPDGTLVVRAVDGTIHRIAAADIFFG